MTRAVLETKLGGIPRFATGKVRDVYDLGDTLLLVTTDRISAFDVVMPNGIPDKGRVLTQLSRHWFRALRTIVPTHYVTCDEDYICDRIAELGGDGGAETRAVLDGRAMLGIKAEAFPIECVVRGYLAGSLWKEYVEAGGPGGDVALHGVALPRGLRESEQLPTPIFTPATKAETGHDENISVEHAAAIVGDATVRELERTSLELYSTAAALARRQGIIIADTKFEFGMHRNVITLIDEALTPDSSRFWDAAIYQPGRSQPSYDKQFVRDWLLASGWGKSPPAPMLPDDVVEHTSSSYKEAYRRIVGRPLGVPATV
jgi:phosphoribosylaminoimidazole-succinocarboxamide synthase